MEIKQRQSLLYRVSILVLMELCIKTIFLSKCYTNNIVNISISAIKIAVKLQLTISQSIKKILSGVH